MNTRLLFAGVLSCLLALMGAAAGASDRPGDGAVQVIAEYAYRPFSVEPLQKARSLALFGARAKAAATAAKYLSHAGRLVHLGDRQKEILYLVAEKIEAVVEAERGAQDRLPARQPGSLRRPARPEPGADDDRWAGRVKRILRPLACSSNEDVTERPLRASE